MKELDILEAIFRHLGRFSCDQAKEIADKERSATKNPQGLSALWSSLLENISTLAVAEKNFARLEFLNQTPNNPKAFRRKELPLHAVYAQLKQDFDSRTIAFDQFGTGEPAEENAVLLGHISEQLASFASLRLDLMDVYQHLHEMGLNKSSDCQNVLTRLEQIIKVYGKQLQHPLLSGLETNFSYETGILKHVVGAMEHISKWNFSTALVHLNHAQQQITVWPSVVGQGSEPSSGGIKISSQKGVVLPVVFSWFQRFYGAILAKFTFYFYEVLAKQTTTEEMRKSVSKLSPDLYSRFVAFHKKAEASSVCLIMDSNGMEQCNFGYVLPGHQQERTTGLERYPICFCHPSEQPTKYLPALIMVIDKETRRLGEPDNVVSVIDSVNEKSFFIAQIEPHFHLAVVFETKKAERDSGTLQFILEMVNHCRLSKVLESLKP